MKGAEETSLRGTTQKEVERITLLPNYEQKLERTGGKSGQRGFRKPPVNWKESSSVATLGGEKWTGQKKNEGNDKE